MKAIGIDLGTTNSVAAIHSPERPAYVLENDHAQTLTPSAVGVRVKDGEERVLVGRPAVQGARTATSTIFSVKRLMGRTIGEPQVAEVRKRFDYEIVPTAEDDASVAIRMGTKVRTPAEISSLILRKIKQDAARVLGDEVTHAVITVPAYFEAAQRAATRKAAEAAGLVVKRLIDEPTAAAIAYGMREAGTEGRRVLVYDLGGGTFDVSLLQMIQGDNGKTQFHVAGVAGDNWLGGDDFDQKVIEKVLAEVRAEHGVEPPNDPAFRRALKEQAEVAKWQLGSMDVADVELGAAFRLPDNGPFVDIHVELTRAEFNQLVAPLVDRTMNLVDDVLREGNFTADDITDVLLVGGSTLTTCVREAVVSRFGAAKVRTDVKPMECVALGAAILAEGETGLECSACGSPNEEGVEACRECGHPLGATRDPSYKIYEQTAMALGIAAIDGDNVDAFVPIIPKGTPYPLEEPMRKRFTASGRRVRIPVHEGVNPQASQNRVQGVVEAMLPEGLEPNSDVEVEFNYDGDRIVTVNVRVPGTTFNQRTSLRPQPIEQDTPSTDEAKEELERAIDMVEEFVGRYGVYIEPWQLDRVKRRLSDAKLAYRGADVDEHRRYVNLLYRDLDNCGLATTMYFADVVADRAKPADSERIRRSSQTVRDAHTSGNEARRAQAEQVLNELIQRELEKQTGGVVTDMAELLRTKP
ncbi:Hsp70 family protein [Actinophytocola sp.]|uniref:Hsp70 family protein n=1 Tax=Actinophytocola sp. TaxID=1872138 RepID=UPI003D6B0DF4